MNNLVHISGPTAELITPDEAKTWLKVDTGADDALIDVLIKAVRQQAEHYCNARFVNQVYEQTFPKGLTTLYLYLGPIVIVNSVSIGETVLDVSLWNYEDSSERVILTQAQSEEVTVNYTVGYSASADDVPECVKDALLLMLAANYENREDPVRRFPTASHHLLNTVRRWVT